MRPFFLSPDRPAAACCRVIASLGTNACLSRYRRKLTLAPYMRIAQISPLFESVPPRGYGGTERVVSYLTEALVALGHDITLFASGDSDTSARLISCAPRALRADGCIDPLPHHLLMLEAV